MKLEDVAICQPTILPCLVHCLRRFANISSHFQVGGTCHFQQCHFTTTSTKRDNREWRASVLGNTFNAIDARNLCLQHRDSTCLKMSGSAARFLMGAPPTTPRMFPYCGGRRTAVPSIQHPSRAGCTASGYACSNGSGSKAFDLHVDLSSKLINENRTLGRWCCWRP
jgi:hypothetical protein